MAQGTTGMQAIGRIQYSLLSYTETVSNVEVEMGMKTSIWHHTADRQPDKAGYYLGYRTMTLADDTTGIDYFYWNHNTGEWRTDNTCYSHWANVYYWTREDPEEWVNSDPPVRFRTKPKDNPALEIAWKNVQEAVRQYDLIKTLIAGDHIEKT